jgi:hypothetical protein
VQDIESLSIDAGHDAQLLLTVLYAGQVLNLSGYTPTVYVKTGPAALDSSALLYRTGTGLTVTDSTNGRITWAISHTDPLTPGSWYWRLDVADGGGHLWAVMGGSLSADQV